jgi:hypothetical protein
VIHRRNFLKAATAGVSLSTVAGASSAAPAFSRSYGEIETYDKSKKRRVGLIGTGWYGKSDLFRLIQIAPVEVVSLCDVDSRMLAAAADVTATRQASGKKPRTYSDYRKMLAEKDLDLVLIATPDDCRL